MTSTLCAICKTIPTRKKISPTAVTAREPTHHTETDSVSGAPGAPAAAPRGRAAQ